MSIKGSFSPVRARWPHESAEVGARGRLARRSKARGQRSELGHRQWCPCTREGREEPCRGVPATSPAAGGQARPWLITRWDLGRRLTSSEVVQT